MAPYPGYIVGSLDRQLFAVNADGSGFEHLTSEGLNLTPAMSKSGRIAWCRVSPQNVPQLWIMEPDGTETMLLEPGMHPAWALDESEIVYTMPNNQIWAVATESKKTRLVAGKGYNIYGSPSPDGKWITYASDAGGDKLQIWVCDIDGTHPVKVTSPILSAPQANAPSWSPDSSKIAFFGGVEGSRGQVHIIDAWGRRALTSVPNDVNADNPFWMGDELIAYETDMRLPWEKGRATTTRTWVMKWNGTDPRILLPHRSGAGRQPWRR